MIITGLISLKEYEGQAANLINSMLTEHNKKTNIISYKTLIVQEEKKIKKYLHEIENNGTDVLILKIDASDLCCSVLTYLKFDIILHIPRNCADGISLEYKIQTEKLLSLFDKAEVLIISEELAGFLPSLNHSGKPREFGTNIMTYGFNSNSNITTSSVGDSIYDKGFILYQQKPIKALNGKTINPQEYRINTGKDEVDIYEVLGAVSFIIAYGIELGLSKHKYGEQGDGFLFTKGNLRAYT